MLRLKRNPFSGYWTYDQQADAGYISFHEERPKSVKTVMVRINPKSTSTDMILDLDADGRIVGIEILSTELMPWR